MICAMESTDQPKSQLINIRCASFSDTKIITQNNLKATLIFLSVTPSKYSQSSPLTSLNFAAYSSPQSNNMMLESKAFDPLMLTEFFAFHAHEILKNSKSAHFSTKNGYFLMFCGSQSHLFSCKQENR